MPPIQPSNIEINNEVNQQPFKKEVKDKKEKPNILLKEKEIKVEESFRPQNLDDYIGQEKLKKIINIRISAAIKRGDPASFGHCLLYGPPGLGKTSCAFLIGQLLSAKVHILSAPALEKPKDIIGILLSVSKGDVVFIDEIHRLNKISEELLYPVLEDFCLDFSTGKGNTAKINRIALPKFIMIGATTKLGSLSAPLRDRFTHIHHLEYYSEEEIAQIISRTSKILNYNLTHEGALIIAQRSRKTPRIANRICRLVRDYLSHKECSIANVDIVEEALNLYEIDKFGLDSIDRKILKAINENYAGGPVGLETLSASIAEDPKTLEDFYEPFLLQEGLLERTSKGRKISQKALDLIEKNIIKLT